MADGPLFCKRLNKECVSGNACREMGCLAADAPDFELPGYTPPAVEECGGGVECETNEDCKVCPPKPPPGYPDGYAPDGFEWVLVPARPFNAPGEGGHYSSRAVLEQIQVNEAWGLDFIEGSAFKYLARYRGKNGVEDLEKAKFYIDRIIAREKREGRG